PQQGQGPPFLANVTQNGMFASVTALVITTPLFLPLTVAVVAGDSIAGEAGHGTLRYLLVGPAGRLRLLLVKYAGAALFCVAAPAGILIAGWVIGTALFGVGPVTLVSGASVGASAAALRSLLVALHVLRSLLGLSAIGLLISTRTDVPTEATASTAVLAVVAQARGQLPQLDWRHPWLFPDHWFGMAGLLREPISWTAFTENLLLQAA